MGVWNPCTRKILRVFVLWHARCTHPRIQETRDHTLDSRMLCYALDAVFERVNYFPDAQGPLDSQRYPQPLLVGFCTPLGLMIHRSKGEAELLQLLFYVLVLHINSENKSENRWFRLRNSDRHR